jgi:pimeloyl-ACP methyl ester carboxylesterase
MPRFCVPLILCILVPSSFIFAQDIAPPGQLVDIGGYKLHMIKKGDKQPTVVFFHGAGHIGLIWELVLPGVSKFATAVAFDHAGEGWSEPGRNVTITQQVFDAHEALHSQNLKGPYIVVGHSLGGLHARVFVEMFPDEVTGVVLVDATHPDVVLRVFNKEKGKAEWKKMRLTASRDAIPEVVKTPLIESANVVSVPSHSRDWGDTLGKFSPKSRQAFDYIYGKRPITYIKGQGSFEAEIMQHIFEQKKRYSLGDIPLIVLTGGKKESPEGDENWSTEELVAHSTALQNDLISLSTNSKQIIAKKSGHHIHIDQPELVVKSIEEVVIKTKMKK